jgi:hypothetical protein
MRGGESIVCNDGGSRDLTATSNGNSRILRDFTFVTAGIGEQEVPPFKSSTSSVLTPTVDPAFTKMSYKLEVFDGVKITQAHLHYELAGKNGPVSIFFFPLLACVPLGCHSFHKRYCSMRMHLQSVNLISMICFSFFMGGCDSSLPPAGTWTAPCRGELSKLLT